MRHEAPLDSGLAGFFALMGDLTCHWRSLVYHKGMETINQEEAMNTIETITPGEHINQLLELRVTFAELVAELRRFEQNTAKAASDLRWTLGEVDKGWGASNAADQASRLAAYEEARTVAYESLKTVLRFSNALYGRDVSRQVLHEVGAEELENHSIQQFLNNDE